MLLEACASKIAGGISVYFTAALLGTSYLGVTIATSLTRQLIDALGSVSRRLY